MVGKLSERAEGEIGWISHDLGVDQMSGMSEEEIGWMSHDSGMD